MQYPMAVKHNKQTGELNAWMPDFTIMARATTSQELRHEVLTLMSEYIKLAANNGAAIPTPSTVESMSAKWKTADGYTIDFISLAELDKFGK